MKWATVFLCSRFARSFACLLILCPVIFLPYSNSFDAEFTFDSSVVILEDVRLHDVSASSLAAIFLEDYWSPHVLGLYRPITTLSFWLNYALFDNGENPFGYHLVNLILHFLNASLAFFFFRHFRFPPLPALLGAAFFGVHPVAVESVTNIVGRSDLISASCVLGASLLFWKARHAQMRRIFYYIGVCLITLIGSLAKESSVVIIGVVILYDLCFQSKHRLKQWGLWLPHLWVIAPVMLVWLFRLILYWGIPLPPISYMDNPVSFAPFVSWQLTAFSVLCRYILLLLFPQSLSVDYSYNQIPLVNWPPVESYDYLAIICFLFVMTLGLWGLLNLRKWPRLWFGVFFFFGCIFPASNIVKAVASIAGERFLYLPSLGFILVMMIFTAKITSFLRKRVRVFSRIWLLSLIVWIIALGCRTYMRNEDWNNNLTLFGSAIKVAPHSARNHSAYAAAIYAEALEAGRLEDNIDTVLHHARTALGIMYDLEPRHWNHKLLTNYATYLMVKASHLPEGEARRAHLVQADKLLSDLISHWKEYESSLRGNVVDMGGRTASPSREVPVTAYSKRAHVQALLGNAEYAAASLQKAIEIDPLVDGLYRRQAQALENMGYFTSARVALVKAIVLGNWDSRNNDWDYLEKLYQKSASYVDPVLEVNDQRGLDIKSDEVRKDLETACSEIYQDLIKTADERRAQQFSQQVNLQFGLSL